MARFPPVVMNRGDKCIYSPDGQRGFLVVFLQEYPWKQVVRVRWGKSHWLVASNKVVLREEWEKAKRQKAKASFCERWAKVIMASSEYTTYADLARVTGVWPAVSLVHAVKKLEKLGMIKKVRSRCQK